MNINKINKNINFQSGLNKKLIEQCKHTDINKVKSDLFLKNIDSDFKSSKSVAFAVSKVLSIFELLLDKTKKNIFKISTPNIMIYSKKDLDFEFEGYGFCLPETQLVIKNKSPFETGSVFYENENSLENLNEKIEKSFNNNKRSSSHYLAPFIHEILHERYIDFIYSKYGYEGNCPYTQKKYTKGQNNNGLKVMQILQNKIFSQEENNIISNILGSYSSYPKNQYHEVFAETFTKLICDSLSDKTSLPIKNPLDKLKKYPIEFLNIIIKLFYYS